MDWEPQDLPAHQRQEMAESYKKHMIYGLMWVAGGTIVTALTISSGQGGIIAWGAIVFGLFDFFRGFNGWMKFK